MSTENKLERSTLTPWKESGLTMVKVKKNEKLKQKRQPKQTKPILCDPDVKSLHKSFLKKLKIILLLSAKNIMSLSS